MGFTSDTAEQLTPLEKSPYPLAFIAAEGAEEPTEPGPAQPSRTYRCEVMGLGRFQKEGLVENVATGRTWRLVCDEGTYLRGADMAPARCCTGRPGCMVTSPRALRAHCWPRAWTRWASMSP